MAAVEAEINRFDNFIARNFMFLPPPSDLESPMPIVEPQELRGLQRWEQFLQDGAGYVGIHGTRPQTLAYALTDSPIGLAALMAEKFWAWSDRDDFGESLVSVDAVLAQITLYWLTQSIGSSMLLYYDEHGKHPAPLFVSVPTGLALSPPKLDFLQNGGLSATLTLFIERSKVAGVTSLLLRSPTS